MKGRPTPESTTSGAPEKFDGSEPERDRAGDLLVERLTKDDGRALIAYWRAPAPR